MTPKQNWSEEFREYFDKHLKPKKPSMKNLDREILVDFINRTLNRERERWVERIEELEEKMNKMFPFNESYYLLPEKEMSRMTGQGEVMMEFNKLLTTLKEQ